MVSFELSLLSSVTDTPPGRAGLVRKTGIGTTWPGATLTPEVNKIPEAELTFTEAMAFETLGAPATAVMVAAPEPTPVTGTTTLVAPASKLTDGGTDAAAGLLELKDRGRPEAGAGEDRFRVVF